MALRFEKKLTKVPFSYEQYHMNLKEWLYYSMIGAGLSGLVVYTFYRSILVFILVLPVSAVYPIYKKKDLIKQRKQQLNIEFKEAIQLLASSLSAGYSVENAFIKSADELKLLYGERGLISEEFAYMSYQIQMKQPVESVLLDFAERSGLDDVENFAQVFAVAKRSGGQLVAIITHTADMIHDRIQVKEEINTLTASKKYEQRIMNFIPFLMILYINATTPGFFQVMYDNWTGRAVMTGCLLAYALAYWLAERILGIEV